MTLPNALRYAAAAIIAPALTTLLVSAGFFAYAGAPGDPGDLRTALRIGMMTGYFVEALNFVPLLILAGRFLRMSLRLAAIIGAVSGWFAPVTYMLLMTLWRGEALNGFVLNVSNSVLSPWLAVFGAIGGAVFWFFAGAARASTPRPRNRQRETLPSPLNGLSGSQA